MFIFNRNRPILSKQSINLSYKSFNNNSNTYCNAFIQISDKNQSHVTFRKCFPIRINSNCQRVALCLMIFYTAGVFLYIIFLLFVFQRELFAQPAALGIVRQGSSI